MVVRMLQQAEAYLRDNGALRRAVGAADGVALEPQHLGAGEHNLNYRFVEPASGRAYVLRINVAAQPFHDNQVAYEFAALKVLKPSGCTPDPVYLDDSASAPGKGALVIGFCEGDELDFDALRDGDLRCAAQLMADVHAVDVAESCTLHRPADPLRELFDECLQRFKAYRASAYEDARITRWAERFMEAAACELDVPVRADARVHVVNTETLPSHFLIPASSAEEAARATGPGRFCPRPGAFIDWERPILGEVAQDVAYFTAPTTTFWDSDYLFPPSQVDAFVEEYWDAVDGRFGRGDFDTRFKVWRKMTALRSVTWCCRALLTYGREGAGYTTEKTQRKLPVYLSDDFMQVVADSCF